MNGKKEPVSSEKKELPNSDELIYDLEVKLRAKVFQHIIISLVQNNRTFTPDFIKQIKLLYQKAEESQQEIMQWIPESEIHRSEIHCKKGCSYCCGLTVHVAIPELYIIFEHLLKTRSADCLKKLIKNLKSYVREMDKCQSVTEKLRIKCTFLENGICSIYECRPFSCRAWNSMNLQSCIDYLTNQDVEIPSSTYYYTPFNTYRQGITRGLSVMGFEDITEELNSGVLRLLEGEFGK